MILTYLGKTVDLTIPKTTLKLKQHIIDELYDNHKLTTVPIYEDEKFFKQVSEYETPENLEERPVKNYRTMDVRWCGQFFISISIV